MDLFNNVLRSVLGSYFSFRKHSPDGFFLQRDDWLDSAHTNGTREHFLGVQLTSFVAEGSHPLETTFDSI